MWGGREEAVLFCHVLHCLKITLCLLNPRGPTPSPRGLVGLFSQQLPPTRSAGTQPQPTWPLMGSRGQNHDQRRPGRKFTVRRGPLVVRGSPRSILCFSVTGRTWRLGFSDSNEALVVVGLGLGRGQGAVRSWYGQCLTRGTKRTSRIRNSLRRGLGFQWTQRPGGQVAGLHQLGWR